MRTQEMLDKMPTKNREYLETLKADIGVMKQRQDSEMVKEYKAYGKGYIRALVDCGVVKDFKTVWCWFTV